VADSKLELLQGQRILITGAARGIGAALAERLASRGARLALIGLEPELLAAVAERCGEDTFVGECDVSQSTQVTAAIDAAAAALGGLDIVVANAGIATAGPLRTQDLRSWERVIETNLLGVMYTDRAALAHLEASRGYLLNIASAAASLRSPGLSAYCAAKAGVEALSDCLRVEVRPFGIQVGVAYFMVLNTDMVRDFERELPSLERGRRELPGVLRHTYPVTPAIDQLVAGIVTRRRRIAYPRWFLKTLAFRQLFASEVSERVAGRGVAHSLAEHERLVAERGARAISSTARTRALGGL